MARKPTDKELALINQLAKRECSADEFYVFDAKPANDFMLTSYFYYLGTTSLMNFKADLDRERLRLGTSHKRDLNLGRWLPGKLVSVDTPEGARPGKNYQLQAPFYMPKGLTIGQYNTDELARGIETGILTDVSIEWRNGTPICDICKNDVRNGEQCPHIPGRLYDGVVCTFTVENAHLGACDLVDDGGLPLATLSDGAGGGWRLSGSGSMQTIKELSAKHPMVGVLSLSFTEAQVVSTEAPHGVLSLELFRTTPKGWTPLDRARLYKTSERSRPTLAELHGSRHPSLSKRLTDSDLYRTLPRRYDRASLFRSGVRRNG